MSTTVQAESRYLTVNGLRLHHLDWGNPSAPPLVFVHGYTSSAQAFNVPARRFCDRFHIIATDVRGHGESAWSPQEAYQNSDQVADLAALVDQLGLGRFTLVGTSMGGRISMAYGGTHSERLERLVINDVGPDTEEGSNRITQEVGARPTEFPSFEAALAFGKQARPPIAILSEEEQREFVQSHVRQTQDGCWVWKMALAYTRIQRSRPNLWSALAGIPCPTLVVWAMESDVLSEGQARRMIEVLPHGELVAVPGIGHAPTLMEPEAVAALDRFLG